jgi:hypothetical protein
MRQVKVTSESKDEAKEREKAKESDKRYYSLEKTVTHVS